MISIKMAANAPLKPNDIPRDKGNNRRSIQQLNGLEIN